MTVTGIVQFVSLKERICLVVNPNNLDVTKIYFPEHCKLPVFGNKISVEVQEYFCSPILRVAMIYYS